MANVLPSHFDSADFLPAEQAIARYKAEKIEPQLDKYRLWDHESFKDFEQRKGKVVHSSRFIHKLRQLNPRIIVQRQINYPDDWGLYIHRDNHLVYLTGLSKGWLTEFSYTTVDEANLPSDPRWGWRHVLVRLMSKGVLSWATVLREFGNCQNANSDRWMMYTQPFRSRQASGIVHGNLKAHFVD